MKTLAMILLGAGWLLATVPAFAAEREATPELLARSLQRYPDADLNKHGKLTIEEFREFRRKRQTDGAAASARPATVATNAPSTAKDPISADLDARLRDCSPITHLTRDDPPVFAMNNQTNEKDGNIHHPNFGRHLKKQMDKVGIECEFHLVSDFKGEEARTDAMLAFLKKNFGMKAKDQ